MLMQGTHTHTHIKVGTQFCFPSNDGELYVARWQRNRRKTASKRLHIWLLLNPPDCRCVTHSSDTAGWQFQREGSCCQPKCITAVWQRVLKWSKIFLPVQMCSREVWRGNFVPKDFIYIFIFWSRATHPLPDGINITVLCNSTETKLGVHIRPRLGL